MNRELGLRVLSGIMGWGTDKAHLEFQRLQLMASLKYDAYRDFEAGVRFVESLASWLQQFELSERETAYELVMNRLVYIGPPEMEKLVGQFYSKFVHPETLATVARELDLPRYSLLTNSRAQQRVSTIRRKSLFLGLSDGARVDFIRHQNVGLISNEQVVGFTQIDDAKWKDLLCELRKDLKSSQATFGSVYLIDDFAGTGTSFFRLHGGEVKGKLARFARSVARAQESLGARIFDPNYKIRIHHYVGTTKARDELTERLTSARTTLDELKLPEDIKTSYGLILPASMPLAPENNDDLGFLRLADRYYDHSIHTRHTEQGGTRDMKRGYGGCALPLVLGHNTPNNSMPLLWAETAGGVGPDGESVPAMRPLFRRRQRHT